MSFKAPPAPPPMKQNRPQPGPETATSQARPKARKPGQMHIALKLLISLLLIWHVSAVFLAPLSIQPSSPLVQRVAQGSFMQCYLDAIYINHGYHFFAPDPGAGHLIKYQVLDSGGAVIKEGEFPNKSDNWPRLLYHRYFMLADQCEVGAESEAEAQRWQEKYLNAYARQVLRENSGAASVRLKRVVHFPLYASDAIRIQNDESMQQYRENPLALPDTYRDELEVVQRRQDLDPSAPAATGGAMMQSPPQQWRQDVASGWQGGVR